MDISKQLQQGTCNLTLSGKFTFSDHTSFRAILEQLSDSSVSEMILHMSQLEFVDSAALGMLLLARDEAEKHHKRLVLSGATGQVKKMFDMAKFNTLFSMS